MTKASELSELQEGLLDADDLHALFGDIAERATVTGIVTKGGELQRAVADPITLEQAHSRLVTRVVHGVQVRYLFDGREWCDTLLRDGEQVRLVRMELPHPDGR